MTDTAISANALARKLGVKRSKVIAWIRRGELTAHNLAVEPTGVPRWRIMPEAIEDFLAGRRAQPAPAPRRRKRRAATAGKEYF